MILVLPILYFAVVMTIGLAHRHARGTEEGFFLAQRAGGTLLLAGSLVATMFGSFGLLGVSSIGYNMGLVAAWYHWAGIAGLLALALWAVPRLQLGGAFSLPELLGNGYGKPVRFLSAALISMAWLGVIAAQLIAAGKILSFMAINAEWQAIANLPVPILILFVTIVFVIYTCLGGQTSVLRTDLLQATVILVSLATLIVITFMRQPGILGDLPGERIALPLNEMMTPSSWLILMLTFGAPFLVGPDIVGRLFCGRDGQTAKRAILIAAALMLPLGFMIALGGVLAAGLAPGTEAELGLLTLSLDQLHPIMAGLLIAALLAAVMSSADTTLMTFSTILSRDVLDIAGLRPSTDKALVLRGRVLVVVGATLALLLAIQFQNIIAAIMTSYRLYAPAVLAPFILMIAFRRFSFHAATGPAAIIAGGFVAAVALLIESQTLGLIAFAVPILPIMGDVLVRRKLR